ncbi:hypothetical protein GZH47_02050 [Paenibacillus rhizovicinus]|uniref:Uncharacterized protein n=1 Tax=Paenibacillus rhizovicinus TaxID=2704463 RepID=A0A6C0NT32_9BACL|nr:hypothetical protein [Paenibacillus rhizovicinus]QHW29360.1 hypothetical protein GZH47_02050 [Paenibacillus rhizovicinus]
MWESIAGVLPAGSILICTILSATLPLLVYTVNKRLHAIGDPPWMKQAAPAQDGPGDPKTEASGANGQQNPSTP